MSGLSVQYGCGFDAPDGWLNFDNSPTLWIERLPVVGSLHAKNGARFPKTVRYGDIVRGLPLAPGSVDRLYASHVIEHLAHDDAIKALKNSLSILKPDGVFRLVVPDLAERARRYVQAYDRADPAAAGAFLHSTLLGERSRPRGVIAALSASFGGSKHLWMWDEPSMTLALQSVGFDRIRRYQFGDGEDPLFAVAENPKAFKRRGIIELAMECRKPI